MATQTTSPCEIGNSGARFVISYDDVSLRPLSIEINGARNTAFTISLLDATTEAVIATRTIAVNDGAFALPANIRNQLTVTFRSAVRPGDGVLASGLHGTPKYIIRAA